MRNKRQMEEAAVITNARFRISNDTNNSGLFNPSRIVDFITSGRGLLIPCREGKSFRSQSSGKHVITGGSSRSGPTRFSAYDRRVVICLCRRTSKSSTWGTHSSSMPPYWVHSKTGGRADQFAPENRVYPTAVHCTNCFPAHGIYVWLIIRYDTVW